MERTLRSIAFAALVLFAFGCDSVDPEDDRERIQDAWQITQVRDEQNDLSTQFDELGTLTIHFQESSFSFFASRTGQGTTTLLNGTYTVVPPARQVAMQARVGNGQTVPVTATYEFVDDDNLELTLEGELIEAVVNLSIEPDVQINGDLTFRMQSAGAQRLNQ